MPLPQLTVGLSAVALAVVTAAGPPPASAADPRPTPTSARRPASAPASPAVVDVVAPNYRDAVADVVRQPTLTAAAAEDDFSARPELYDWLLDHPDRVSLAWRRMDVPCVEITRTKSGAFAWTDPNGSELTWQPVGRFPDGRVWYATGNVKPGALLPTVPVKAVAVLHAPRSATADGTPFLRPTVKVYLLTDSRAAAAVLRILGPAAPRMAEQGAEQLLLFFSGVAGRLSRNPDRVDEYLAPAPR